MAANFMYNWPTSAEAKKKYFLTTEDFENLQYQIPPWHRFGMGRPTRSYNPTDLKRKAEGKHGVEGYKAKLESKENREKKRQLKESKDAEEVKKFEAKKAKLVEENPDTLKQVVTDLTSLCGLTQKCDHEQLQQLLLMMGEKNRLLIGTVNEVKDVAMLPRKKFKELQPKLAKLFNTDPDVALKKSTQKHKKQEEAQQHQKDLNEQVEGKWKLCITSPPKCEGETGELTVSLFGGSCADGEIYLDETCAFGNIEGFKDKSNTDSKTMSFTTRAKVCGKRYKGSLSVSVSKDSEGILLTGSFWQGFTERKFPSRWQFTGRKMDD